MGTRIEDWLKALPPVTAPPGLYGRVRAAQLAELGRRRHRVWLRGGGLALAAGVVLAVALALVAPPPGDEAVSAMQDELQALHDRSRALETLLARFDAGSRVVDLRTAQTIVDLEDHIAAVDSSLRTASLDHADRESLWRQRVGLMEALVGMHIATTTGVEF